jgi:hypothetical protein
MDGLGVAGLEAIGGESGHLFAWEVVMAMAYVICPACFIGHQYDQRCATPGCALLQSTPKYQRDQLEGQLLIVHDMVTNHPDDRSEDWASLMKELTAELAAFDQEMVEQVGLAGAAAKTAARFKQ